MNSITMWYGNGCHHDLQDNKKTSTTNTTNNGRSWRGVVPPNDVFGQLHRSCEERSNPFYKKIYKIF